MIPIGIGLTVLGFIGLLTGPVGWALIGACIGIGVAAVGFGAATTYLAYKSDHDQAMRLKELNIRNGFVTQAIATHDTIKAQQEDAKKDSKIQKLKQEAVVAKASIEKLTAELAKQSAEKIVHPQKGAHPVGITVSHDKVVTLHGVMNDMLHPTNHQQPVNASVAPQQARNEEVEETKEEKKGEPGAHSPSSHT